MRTKRVRNWQAQPTETPMACAVCSSDNPNSSGNTTACACLNSSTVLAFAKVTLATSSNSLPLALLPISTPRWLRCGYYFIDDLEMERVGPNTMLPCFNRSVELLYSRAPQANGIPANPLIINIVKFMAWNMH
jgi:hypothetical protein